MQDKFWNNPQVVEDFSSRPCSKYIVDEVEDILSKNKIETAIDIGCGGGRYSKFLKQRNVDVFSIDKNQAMVEFVKTFNQNAKECDMSKIDAPSESFDLVLSIGVMHNAVTDEQFNSSISEIARVLKPNAYAVVSIFTNKHISSDLTHQGGNLYYLSHEKPPMILCSQEDIVEKFERAGLALDHFVDEHLTDVGTGERNVLSLCFIKK